MNASTKFCWRYFGVVTIVLAATLLLSLTPMRSVAQTPASEPLVTQAARSVGVRRCFPAIEAIAKRATVGVSQQDIVLDWDRRSPDSGAFFSLTGIGAGKQRAVVTISAFPQTPGNCAVLVERISALPGACDIVAATELRGFQPTQLIPGITIYQSSAQSAETYTLVDGSGACLLIRRQAALRWPLQP
jgi:hypothetical protein